jgi:hypothetical protein
MQIMDSMAVKAFINTEATSMQHGSNQQAISKQSVEWMLSPLQVEKDSSLSSQDLVQVEYWDDECFVALGLWV